MNKQALVGKRLCRSASDKQIAGVCGGIAAYLDIDSTVIRLGWVILTILTGVAPGVIGYIIAAIIMPRDTT